MGGSHQPRRTGKKLRAALVERLAPEDCEVEPVALRPENRIAWGVFNRCHAQWHRAGMNNMRTGLNYESVWKVLEKWPAVEADPDGDWWHFEKVQYLESMTLIIDAIKREGTDVALKMNNLESGIFE